MCRETGVSLTVPIGHGSKEASKRVSSIPKVRRSLTDHFSGRCNVDGLLKEVATVNGGSEGGEHCVVKRDVEGREI